MGARNWASPPNSLPTKGAHAVLLLCALLVASVPAGGAPRLQPPYAPDWIPTDLADARERPVGNEKELHVSVAGVEVSVPSEFRCRVGVREELPMLLAKRSDAAKRIRITGTGPRGVMLDPTNVRMGPKKLMGRVTPAVQTVLLHDAYLMITLEVGNETARMPMKLLAEPTRPVFGVRLPDADDPEWQSDELRGALLAAANVPAQLVSLDPRVGKTDGLSLEEVLEAGPVRPPLLLSLADWFSPDPQATRAAVERRREDVHVLSAGSLPALTQERENAALAGRSVLEAAESLLNTTRALNLGAELLSPLLPRSTAERATFESKVLLWLLENGVGEHVGSLSFDIGTVSAPGADDPESWQALDRSSDIRALSSLAWGAPNPLGVWCGAFGIASSGDPGLDALAAVRRQVALAFQGVRGAVYSPLALPGLKGPAPGEPVPMYTGPAGGETPMAAALGEALTELAGVQPIYEPEDSPPCSKQLGSEITFMPFLRGNEGIVWVWSNAQGPRTLRLVMRQEPLGKRQLTFRPKEPYVERDVDLLFVAKRRPKDRSYYLEFASPPWRSRRSPSRSSPRFPPGWRR